MKRAAAGLALAAALAACSAGGGGPRGPAPPQGANPGQVIASQMGFARMAQDQGQWTAFAHYAAPEAVLFTPETTPAQAWLRGRANPAQAPVWQPHAVWTSCDGSLAVTAGLRRWPDGRAARFTTVWQRLEQGRDRGQYRWVLDQEEPATSAPAAPEMVAAHIAQCRAAPAAVAQARAAWEAGGALAGGGQSADGTLAYRYGQAPDGSARLRLGGFSEGSYRPLAEGGFGDSGR